jgi:acyl-CoA thioesterase
VGNLDEDTAVEGGEGRYRARLSPDWEIWGPNGGYVASVALRAAAAASRFDRPASFMGHFLSTAAFDTVDLEVTPLRQAKRAESLRVSMTQEGRPVLEALVWLVDDVQGLEHDHARAPDARRPDTLRPIDEQIPPDTPRPPFTFFDNVEERPLVDWVPWEEREPGEPRIVTWFRFRPRATFDDPVVDACRYLILADTMEWPAATRAHRAGQPWIAPSLDVAVRFHRAAPESAWLLSETAALVATEGLVGGSASVWSEDGQLLASGGQQMLCRPAVPSRP